MGTGDANSFVNVGLGTDNVINKMDAIKLMGDIAELSATSLYAKLSDVGHFYLLQPDAENILKQNAEKICECALKLILSIYRIEFKSKNTEVPNNEKFSVSACFKILTSKQVVSKNGKESSKIVEGYATPFVFFGHGVKTTSCSSRKPGTWKKESDEGYPQKNKPHWGYPVSQRFIEKMEVVVNGESKPQKIEDPTGCTYIGELINDYAGYESDLFIKDCESAKDFFDDGYVPKHNDPNESPEIHQRNQVLLIPIECVKLDGRRTRIGYLQLTAYQDSWISRTDTVNDEILKILQAFSKCLLLLAKIVNVESIKKDPNKSDTYRTSRIRNVGRSCQASKTFTLEFDKESLQ